MNHSKSDSSRLLEKCGILLFFTLFAYVLLGAYPIGPYEADGPTIANGAYFLNQCLANENYTIQQAGWDGIIYRYDVQAGTYQLVRYTHLFTGLDYYASFSVICIIAFIGVIFFSAHFLATITKAPLWATGICLLSFPEMMVIAGYPNSNIIALLFVAASFSFAVRKKFIYPIISAVLLSLAIWSRFDAILLIPVYTTTLWLVRKNAVREIFVVGVIVAALTPLLLLLSHTSIGTVVQKLSQHGTQWENVEFTISNYIAFFPLAIALSAAFGIFHLIILKDYKRITFVTLGTIPIFVAYGWTVTTGKYLIYTIIPISLLVVYGYFYIFKTNNRFRLISFMVLGFAFSYAYLPLGLPAYQKQIQSHDGPRTVTSVLANPFKTHKEKFRKRKAFREATNFLLTKVHTNAPINVVTYDKHEITANLMMELISEESTTAQFIKNYPDFSKLFSVTHESKQFDLLAFYSGSPIPQELMNSDEVTMDSTYLVYWTKWPPSLETLSSRETAFKNSRLSIEKVTF